MIEDSQATAHLALYNRAEFSALNIAGDQRYYRVDLQWEGRFVGSLAGVIDGARFVSGFSAGFGGADLLRERERLEPIVATIGEAVETLHTLGLREIQIRAKPLHYSSNEHYLAFACARAGFVAEQGDLDFYLDTSVFPSAGDYLESLRHAPKRQLKLALAAPYTWRELTAVDEWSTGYEVLVQSRERHGATVSLTLDYLHRLRGAFGESIRMYVLERNGEAAATVLLYCVTPGRGQVMYWGDRELRQAREGGSDAPIAIMNLVAYKTVETAISLGLKTVDLGPSTSPSTINYGNCAFKSSIGALPDFRTTLTKTFES